MRVRGISLKEEIIMHSGYFDLTFFRIGIRVSSSLNGEKGKSKWQFSYGQFASAQFKVNLSGLSDNLAYDLFSESQITTLSLNLEARYQNYQNFQDTDLAISGTSLGLGFTFEFL